MEEARTGFGEEEIRLPPPPYYGEDAEPSWSYGETAASAPTYGESSVGPARAGRAADGRWHELEPVAACRERSSSIWIYFPHVELVFLLYGVQGSLAVQLEVLRHGDGVVFYVAAIALVSTKYGM